MNISDIKEHASRIDAEEVSLTIIDKIKNGDCAFYFEALVEYCESADIEIEEIKKYLTPFLIDKIYAECCNNRMLKDTAPLTPIDLYD